jgi:hypothetical protein
MTTRLSCGGQRHALLALAVTLIAGSVPLLGCSQQGSAEQLNAPVGITTRQTTIAIQNRAGVPLSNVRLTVVAFGNTEFTRALGGFEKEESREVNLSQLSSKDGTAFNAMLSKPKLVRFNAVDADGKPVDVEVAWK